MATSSKKSTSKPKTTAKKSKAKVSKSTKSTSSAKTTSASVSSSTKTSSPKLKVGVFKNLNTENLRKMNLILGALLAVQAVVILVLMKSTNASRGVVTSFLTKDTLASSSGQNTWNLAVRHLFDVNLGYLVSGLLLVAALISLAWATFRRKKYEASLSAKVNKSRWMANMLIMGVALLTLALVNGVLDISALLMLFVLSVIMNLASWALEAWNKTGKKASWLCGLAGVTPWIVLAIYLWGSKVYGTGLPMFVFWLDLSMLILFVLFVRTMRMMQIKKGKWADYLYGERMYMLIGFVSLSALAWQVFAGLLR